MSFMSQEKKRLVYFALFIFALFSLLIVQFYRIQLIEGSKWADQAEKQHYFVIQEPFIRGTFYSNASLRKNHPDKPQAFVVDLPRYHLYADVLSIPKEKKEEIATSLIEILNLNATQGLKLHTQFSKKSRSRKLAMWLNIESYEAVQNWWKRYAREHKIARNALFFMKDYQRSYPFGYSLGQVLHTIQYQKDENKQVLPTGGLELYFNNYLQGKPGQRRLMRSPRNSFETGEILSLPEHGADIYLTINEYLQAILEEELEKGVKKCSAKCGWAAMMDPYTGEILAMGQYPFFNPPEYRAFFNDPARIQDTKVKALTDANEPGSVFKPFTVVVALKANEELLRRGERPIFTPEEFIPTANGRFPGRSKPIEDTSLHYYLNMDMGMQKSSNIYMGRLAERIVARLGDEWYRKQLQTLFGFGLKTNIELPAESAGVLPTPGKYHPNGALEWSIPTPFSLAMGHNIQVTAIQLLRAYAVLANGGYFVQPTLVRKIVKKDENGVENILVDHTHPERIKQFPHVLDQKTIDRVLSSMRFVTKTGGTATKADVHGYTEVGKTSTPKKIVNGRYSERLYCPIFTGFTPVNHPAFILAVTIDEPAYGYIQGIGKNHHGGNRTASVFTEIARRSLEFLGVPPDDPYGYPYGDPRHDLKKTEWMKETMELIDLYDKWNKRYTKEKKL